MRLLSFFEQFPQVFQIFLLQQGEQEQISITIQVG